MEKEREGEREEEREKRRERKGEEERIMIVNVRHQERWRK